MFAFALIASLVTVTPVVITADRPDSIYAVGEPAVLSVRAERNGAYVYRLSNNGTLAYDEGRRALKAGETFAVTNTSRAAGFLWMEVTDADDASAVPVRRGVVYNPQEILPVSPNPDDFDAFWADAVAKDKAAARPITIEPAGEYPGHLLYRVKIPTVHGRTLYGCLSEPKDLSRGPFETVVSIPGAGPSSWGAKPEAEEGVHLRVNVHYYDPTPIKDVTDSDKRKELREKLQAEEDAEWSAKFPSNGHRRYATSGIAASREDYFYYDFILAMNRAIDWLATRPSVDRRRLYYFGGSQGGGLGLVMLGLNRSLAFGRVDVPAMADSVGYLAAGRRSGWPHLVEAQLPENREAAMRNAPYFDSANFARRIRKPIVMTVGLCDPTCPPHTCYAAFNVIPAADKKLIPGVDMQHHVEPDVDRRARAEIARLCAKAADSCTAPVFAPGKAGPFRKANWRLDRHDAIMNRIRTDGRTCASGVPHYDLVLLGDSISELWEWPSPRWGSEVLDELKRDYKVLGLGFGGDKTQDVLGRIEKGELDGYTAKVISFCIGSNNHLHPPSDTATGVRACLDEIRRRHPESKIVLWAIPPCRDPKRHEQNTAVNDIIRTYADGVRIVWNSLTDVLTRESGTLREELLPDGLHPTKEVYAAWAARLRQHLRGDDTTAVPAACGNSLEHGGCYAHWSESALVIGNRRFERHYAGTDRLETALFRMRGGANLAEARGCGLDWRRLTVEAQVAAYSPVGETGLVVRVTTGGETTELWIFPDTTGPLAFRPRGADEAKYGAGPSDYVAGYPWRKAKAEGMRAETDVFLPATWHPVVTAFELSDRTDGANELCQTKQWALHPCEEPVFVSANVLDVRDPQTGSGVVFLRLAPLPKSRPDPTCDFVVSGTPRAIAPVANGYPVAELAYAGGDAGRVRALVVFQRALRTYRPERDGLFLSNTWGDGNRDSRINEAFLLKEVAAGAELGVDVIQIDDGWQKGRTANSSAVKSGDGTWGRYWDVDEEFWRPCPERFPQGLGPVVAAAKAKGLRFGLWFGPDSSNECRHWEKDAACLVDFHRALGIDYFKMDSMKILSGVAATRQRQMFDRMLVESQGRMTFDLDCTANVRPGYFGLPDIGPLFVENRYIRPGDSRRYYPHQTLRSLWTLAHAVDPVRLRMEVLNPRRNSTCYGKDDPLAPSRWPVDSLLAITLCASPLGWFEISNLDSATVATWKPLVATWKRERANLHGGVTHPVGAAPDGFAWTGFVTEGRDGDGYALLFRELNSDDRHELDLLPFLGCSGRTASVLAGRGVAVAKGTRLCVSDVPPLGYVWVKLESGPVTVED